MELALSYRRVPGYSFYSDSHPIYELPFAPSAWFCQTLPLLTSLRSDSALLIWHCPAMFSALLTLDLTGFTESDSITASTLAVLFDIATGLQVLRIGALNSAEWPCGVVLSCPSLRVLDFFFRSELMALIVSSMMLPGVTDLVVRGDGVFVVGLLDSPRLLSQVISLTLLADVSNNVVLYRLFASVPLLQSLDICHSTPRVFTAYCVWAFSRLRMGQPDYASNIDRLFVGRVDLDVLALLVKHVEQSMSNLAGAPSGVRVLRVEHPSFYTSFVDSRIFLRAAVFNFAFTNYHPRRVYHISTVSRATDHSLFGDPGDHIVFSSS
ncbi:hypothetical protein B0H17DRAFT_1197526 [Mycena rosella]|uniref:Uncharacterized protein n=1 Tax=Mycena rosella TaxID=1033263 RepID=A0AAD7DQQ4_MYCRO|nr:hypothetical protein B0H17DRAFT_1197526 [Mycena rosella]